MGFEIGPICLRSKDQEPGRRDGEPGSQGLHRRTKQIGFARIVAFPQLVSYDFAGADIEQPGRGLMILS